MTNEEYLKLQIEGSDWSYGSRWGDQMEAAILELFSGDDQNLHQSIIDIGCGEGRGLDTFKRIGYKNLCGIDISEEKLYRARSRGWSCVKNWDFHYLYGLTFIEEIPPFNVGFCSHTLEHSWNINLAIESMMSVISNKLIIIVPTGESIEDVKKYNPSHTSPIKNDDHITNILNECQAEKFFTKWEHYKLKRPSLGPEFCAILYK